MGKPVYQPAVSTENEQVQINWQFDERGAGL
jgi:hypothetical protein